MQRSAATVVALVGSETGALLGGLGRAGAVRAVTADPALDPIERAVLAQRGTAGAGAPLAVHDADPLAAVAAAWVRLFDGSGAIGELEVARVAVLQRWRAGAFDLPDFYVLLDPDGWDPTLRHWYLGVLTAAAPSRVLPVRGADEVPAALRHLPAGRWWPELGRLLEGVERRVPDALVTREPGAPALLQPGR